MAETILYSQDFEASTSLPSGMNFDAGFAIDATSKLSGANALAITATASSAALYATQDGVSGNADVGVTARVDSPGASSQVNLYARMSDATTANVGTTANYYRARVTLGSAPATWQIVKRSGGVSTTLLDSSTKAALASAISTGTLLASATAYRFHLVADGGASPGTNLWLEIQRISDGLWLNGSGVWQATRTNCLSVVDSSSPVTGQGYSGFGTALASGATAYLDDFALVDYFDPTTYTKSWADYSDFTDGVGTITPSLFSGGTEPGLVLAGDGVTHGTVSGFNDRRYANTTTGRVAFQLSAVASPLNFYFKARTLQVLFASSTGVIQLRDATNTVQAQILYLAAQWVSNREYTLIFRFDGATAKVAFLDTVALKYLDNTAAFASATPTWALSWTMPAPANPGVPFQFATNGVAGAGASDLAVGPIKLGPLGTPQVTPNPATVAAGGSQVFAPLYFTGVDTTASATTGTILGNTYIAPGSAGSDTATFSSPIGGESVAVPITITASTATTYTLTGPTTGSVGVASTNFTVTPDAAYTGTITITPSGGGLSTPIVLTFSGSATPQTFTITPTAAGVVTLTPTNDGGLTNPSAPTYTATVPNATGYTLSASPASVAVGGVSTITATIVGGSALASTLTITLADDHPSTISGTIAIADGSTTGTATVTATVDGTHLITATHSGGGFAGGDGSTSFAAGMTPPTITAARRSVRTSRGR